MPVETVQENGSGVWVVGMVGQRSERFRRVTLTAEDMAGLTIADSVLSYSGDGRRLRLALQAYVLGIAYEFDPYFGLSISRVDPLPQRPAQPSTVLAPQRLGQANGDNHAVLDESRVGKG